jgi:tetratricopeptide (TPR) repeat protein
MASRVNIRFVIILSVVLAMVFVGVAGAFFYVKLRSGDRYVRLGDEAMARGDIKLADRYYASAVGKEQNNVAWLTKWRDARTKKIPERQSAYKDEYSMYVFGILRTLAATQRTNMVAHHEYLDAIQEQCRSYYRSRESWQQLIDAAEAAMVYYEPEQPPELRAYRGVAISAMAEIGAEVKPEQLETARKDLEAALAANPRDGEAASSLAALHRFNAGRARLDGNAETAKAETAAAVKCVTDAVAADPASPVAIVAKLIQDTTDAEESIDRSRPPVEVARARTGALDRLRPRVAEAAERLKAADPAKLTPPVISRFMGIAVAIDAKQGLEQSQGLTSSDARCSRRPILCWAWRPWPRLRKRRRPCSSAWRNTGSSLPPTSRSNPRSCSSSTARPSWCRAMLAALSGFSPSSSAPPATSRIRSPSRCC